MLKFAGIGCGVILVIALVAVALAVRSHRRWLAAQNPAGVWQGTTPDGGSVLLSFDGGPHEGVYRELRVHNGVEAREFGHWTASGNDLRLIIMATDTPNHPRFGQDTLFHITYTGPEQITLNGPDRAAMKLDRAAPGTDVPLQPNN
jgi:hypothetical protein